jgi:hypothetical protein
MFLPGASCFGRKKESKKTEVKMNKATNTTSTRDSLRSTTFSQCIDLPGESVQCWDAKIQKIKIILRKHRDIVFDIKIFKGMQYQIYGEKDSVYCSDSKKLYAAGEKITLSDGEVRYCWVARNFKGGIIVSAAGKVIGKYYPCEQDSVIYSADPGVKPLPLMISLRNFSETKKKPWSELTRLEKFYRADKQKNIVKNLGEKIYTEKEIEATQAMHIIWIDQKKPGMPENIANFIQAGGQQMSFDAGNVITRNWIASQIVGLGAFYSDNGPWVKELWKKEFQMIKVIHGGNSVQYYLVFKGDPALRRIFTASRYAVGDMQVLAFTAGIGARGKVGVAVAEGVKGALKKCGLLAVLFTITLDVAEWLKDYSEYDPVTGKSKRDITDLIIKIGVNLGKVALNAAITTVLVGLFVGAGIITGGVGLVVGSLVLGMLVGYGIDFVDNELGASSEINKAVRSVGQVLNKKMPNDYNGYEDDLEHATQFEFGAS